jgi:asparagine synthase (glutamine-hydrolysing)
MCGIAGAVNLQGLSEQNKTMIREMAEALRHRGPDGEGYYFSEPVIGLGHRRLSVIDLATGDQPIANEDGSIILIFNGEIYNFQELRVELQQKGHRFSTNTDTEVIVHLYEDMGANCVSRLRGMFAFAVWDKKRRQLFLARDRLGKKPLYYAQVGDTFLFASELKALLLHKSISRRINSKALDLYLTYLYVPPPETIFEGVFKLPQAHTLIYDQRGIRLERYWNVQYTPKVQLNEDEMLTALVEKLTEATRLRLVSDVPLGAFLSGGIDSSVIVALMTSLSPTPVKTFSVGFAHQAYNELDHARIVADQFNTDHHEIMITAKAADVLPKLVWAFDEPFADPSAIPTYYVAKTARQHVTVALNGDGGDELFAGYGKYLGSALRTYYRYLPDPVRRGPLRYLLGRVPEGVDQKSRVNRLRRLNELSLLPVEEANIQASVYNGLHRWREALYSSDAWGTISTDPLNQLRSNYRNGDGVQELDRFLRSDLLTYLPDDLLVKADRMTMVHGLEGRSPLLDHTFVEFVASLPTNMKLRGVTMKYALRKVGEKLGLPRSILDRPKQGFEIPLADWLKTDLREMRDDLLLHPRMVQLGYFNDSFIRSLLAEHDSGAVNHAERIYTLLILELWCKTFLS